MSNLAIGRFKSVEPASGPTLSISVTTTSPVVLATIDFSEDPLVYENSQVWLKAAVGWRGDTGPNNLTIVQFGIFDTDPTTTPGAVPIYQTRDEVEVSRDNLFTTVLAHIASPTSNTPAFYLTANLSPLSASGSATITGPVTLTASEIGQE